MSSIHRKVKFRAFLTALSCIVLLHSFTTPAEAYERNGIKWPFPTQIISAYTDVTGNYSTALNQAITNFNTSTQVHLSRHDGAPWVAQVQSYGAVDWEGMSKTNTGNGVYTVTWARSKVNTAYIPASTAVSRIKILWLHELCHVWGLGHTTNPRTVMYWNVATPYANGISSLTSDEINGINSIYRKGAIMKRTKAIGVAIAVLICATCTLSACSTDTTQAQADDGTSSSHGQTNGSTSTEFSRVKLYETLDDLAADSSLIVIGTAEAVEVTHDIDGLTPFSVFNVAVSEVLKGDVAVGDTVVMRQTGGEGDPGVLEDGQTALLYLTPTGLDGELASQYYPVGVTAGVYVLDGDVAALSADNDSAATFSHTVTDTGDSIPNVLSLEEAKDSL